MAPFVTLLVLIPPSDHPLASELILEADLAVLRHFSDWKWPGRHEHESFFVLLEVLEGDIVMSVYSPKDTRRADPDQLRSFQFREGGR